MSSQFSAGLQRRLVREVVCQHCWTSFAPEDALWIAEAPSMIGDYKLGEAAQARFLPTTFDERGAAVDGKGYSCRDVACPHCHLKIPSCTFDAPCVFMSIVGAPACGKSYYLASSTFALRSLLPTKFLVNFRDADPEMNERLRNYEMRQFIGPKDLLIELEKTETEGDFYNQSKIDGIDVKFPKPFSFLVAPNDKHPAANSAEIVARTICLYDNAGENYLPTQGADTALNPGTRHLAQSSCVFFVFDPTQDPRIRKACSQFSNDPQLKESNEIRRSPMMQETVFSEAVRRARALRNMSSVERSSRPLVVIVAKADAWWKIVPGLDLKTEPIKNVRAKDSFIEALDMKGVRDASVRVRGMLMNYTPEFVSVVEGFASDVVYIPVSATGISPVEGRIKEDGKRALEFRPSELSPKWSAVPMLYALSKTTKNIVYTVESSQEDARVVF